MYALEHVSQEHVIRGFHIMNVEIEYFLMAMERSKVMNLLILKASQIIYKMYTDSRTFL